jgi:hypothetical protein
MMPCPYSVISQMRVGARQYISFDLRLMIDDAVPLQFGIGRLIFYQLRCLTPPQTPPRSGEGLSRPPFPSLRRTFQTPLSLAAKNFPAPPSLAAKNFPAPPSLAAKGAGGLGFYLFLDGVGISTGVAVGEGDPGGFK